MNKLVSMETADPPFWREASRGGAAIGLVLIASFALRTFSDMHEFGFGWLVSLLEVMFFAGLIYVFSRNYGLRFGYRGYTFAQSIGFIVAMMLFAGFLFGVGIYIIENYVATDYYEMIYDERFDESAALLGIDDMDENLGMAKMLIRKPLFVVFVKGVLSTVVYGSIIGLFASSFVKRKPEIF